MQGTGLLAGPEDFGGPGGDHGMREEKLRQTGPAKPLLGEGVPSPEYLQVVVCDPSPSADTPRPGGSHHGTCVELRLLRLWLERN